jgi:hypothetical protein
MTNQTGTVTEELYVMPSAGAALTSTTKSVITANSSSNPPWQLSAPLWLPSYSVARGLHITCRGLLTTGSSPGTLTLGCYYDVTQNSTSSQILIAGTGALTPPASLTNGAFEMEFDLTIQSIGVSGAAFTATADAHGVLSMGAANNAAATAATVYMVGASGITFNPMTAYFVEVWATWSTASGDSIQCTQFIGAGLN